MNYKNYFIPTKSATPSYNKTNLDTLNKSISNCLKYKKKTITIEEFNIHF